MPDTQPNRIQGVEEATGRTTFSAPQPAARVPNCNGFAQALHGAMWLVFRPAAGSAILAYGAATTFFQYWIVRLVEERVRHHDRLGLAFINLVLMPAGQALVLAVFFEAAGDYCFMPPQIPSAFARGLSRIFPLWIGAMAGFLFGGLLLSVLPHVGKYFRDPEVSIFCGGFFVVVAYKTPGLISGLWGAWVFARDRPLMAMGLLALAKGISLACRYVMGILMARRGGGQRRRKATPRSLLALVLGISSTLMLVPLLAVLRLLSDSPH